MTILVKDEMGNVVLEKELQQGESVCEIKLNDLVDLKKDFINNGAYH